MNDNRIFFVAGLGNPGLKYAGTRHNIGFMTVDELARRLRLPIEKNRFDASYSKGMFKGSGLILAKPLSFMNLSGIPVQRLSSYFKIPPSSMIILHDDLDLDFGRIMIVSKRGHGGHNGIRSICQTLGTNDFVRIRIGVGRPDGPREVTSHVLGGFSPEEEKELKSIIDRAADACIAIMENGPAKAMNTFNTRA